MVMLVLITAGASAALDNVTTVLLVAPITLQVGRRLDVPPVPFLIAEVFAASIGGTATLIGDPPNITIASHAGLSFNAFLSDLAPIVLVLVAVLLGLCRVPFRSAFVYDPKRARQVMELDEREAISDRMLFLESGAVLGAVLVLAVRAVRRTGTAVTVLLCPLYLDLRCFAFAFA
jgi:Na+/H+ antiporter NhaD/arsenite permease-like protein